MRWIVNITNEKNKRIVVHFLPEIETISFSGEYRIKHNEWTVFCRFTHQMKIELKDIKSMMFKIINKMNERIKEYKNISEGFEIIKEIEVDEN